MYLIQDSSNFVKKLQRFLKKKNENLSVLVEYV